MITWRDYSDDIMSFYKEGYSSTEIGELLEEFHNLPDVNKPRQIRRVIQANRNQEEYLNVPHTAKILVFDIETAPHKAFVWKFWKTDIGQNQVISDWFCLTWSAKWLFEDNVISAKLTPDEAKNEDDERIIRRIWTLLDEADIVVAHNCVDVNTRVLKQDLTWSRAGDLKVGDKLVGFEEGLAPNETFRDSDKKWKGFKGDRVGRKVQPCQITDFTIASKPCVKVTFDNGDEIITTKDHYWLAMTKKDNFKKWIKSEDLQPGFRVNKFCTPWEKETNYDAGWLAGFISGEGSLSKKYDKIQICQRPTSTWDKALAISSKLGLNLSVGRNAKTGGLGRQDTLYADFLGGKWDMLEIIGKLDIERFKEKIDWNNFGSLKKQGDCVSYVVSVEDVGDQNVAVFGTTSKTFIAEGYPMHNCNGFDIPKLNTRFLQYNLPPPSPYDTIDTLAHCRKRFKFSSNRLNYINAVLGLEVKAQTGGFDLWAGCMEGNPESLKIMEDYNIQDVKILEDLYLKLRPWIKPHPNVGLFVEDNIIACPSCGHHELESCGTYNTYVNTYEALRCKNCGSVNRSRRPITNKVKAGNIIVSTPR